MVRMTEEELEVLDAKTAFVELTKKEILYTSERWCKKCEHSACTSSDLMSGVTCAYIEDTGCKRPTLPQHCAKDLIFVRRKGNKNDVKRKIRRIK